MKPLDEILDTIAAGLAWYYEKGPAAAPEVLIKARDRLAIRSYYLAEQAATHKIDYNSKRFAHKIEVSRSKQAMIGKNSPVNKAENAALLENKATYQAELEAEGIAYKCDLLLRQVNQVLAAMQQRIAQLKVEKDYTQKQNTA